MAAVAPLDPIRHVVMLQLENRSFDHYLGAMPGVDGVSSTTPFVNRDSKGKVFEQKAGAEFASIDDYPHNVPDIQRQLENKNSGFILATEVFDRQESSQTSDERKQQVMSHFEWGKLEATHALAANFTVCDRWFCSAPADTFPNRWFSVAGTASGERDQTLQRSDTIFTRLQEKGVPWKIYFHDLPTNVLFMKHWEPHHMSKMVHMNQFYQDCKGAEKDFPAVCQVEPQYDNHKDLPANDCHPPHDCREAEYLVASVFNAVRANEALWRSTVIILYFDEHGGLFDHVPPPSAVEPDDKSKGYPWNMLGPRVPCILISPWCNRGVDHTLFDHTSVLRYLIDKYQLRGLGRRAAAANSILPLLTRRSVPRTDCPPGIRINYVPLKATGARPMHGFKSDLLKNLKLVFKELGHDLRLTDTWELARDAVLKLLGKERPPEVKLSRDWNTSICGGLCHPCLCLRTILCPCCQYGLNVSRMGIGTSFCSACCGFLVCMPCCCGCIAHSNFRNNLRTYYNLNNSCCTDTWATICCPYCTICQEALEIEHRGTDPTKAQVMQ